MKILLILTDDGKGKSEDNIKHDKNHFNSVDGKGDLKDKMKIEEDDKENCENFHKKSENSPFNTLNRVGFKGITNQGGESYSDSFGGKGTTDLFSDYSKNNKENEDGKDEKIQNNKIEEENQTGISVGKGGIEGNIIDNKENKNLNDNEDKKKKIILIKKMKRMEKGMIN